MALNSAITRDHHSTAGAAAHQTGHNARAKAIAHGAQTFRGQGPGNSSHFFGRFGPKFSRCFVSYNVELKFTHVYPFFIFWIFLNEAYSYWLIWLDFWEICDAAHHVFSDQDTLKHQHQVETILSHL